MHKCQPTDFLNISSVRDFSLNCNEKHIACIIKEKTKQRLFIYSIENKTLKKPTKEFDTVSFVKFSPSDKNLLLVKAARINDQYLSFFFLNIKNKTQKKLPEPPDTLIRFGNWSPQGDKITYAINKKNEKDFKIKIFNLKTNTTRDVFSLKTSCSVPGFSPKESFLIILEHISSIKTNCYLLNLKTNKIKKIITNNKSQDFIIAGIKWLSDESGFYYISDKNCDRNSLYFFDLVKNKSKLITETPGDLQNIHKSNTEKFLFLAINEGGKILLYKFNIKNNKLSKKIEFPKGSIDSFLLSKDNLAIMTCSSPTQGSSLYSYNKSFKQLIASKQKIPPKNLVSPISFYYKSFDNLKIQNFLFLPKNKKIKYPLFIFLHGGPASLYVPNYNSLIQFLVNKGYAVAAPNIRGSSGYGKKFKTLDDKEKRYHALKDVIYLQRFLKKEYNQINTDKTILCGESYGGFLTMLLLALYPQKWLKGISISGISNFITYLENIPEWRRPVREEEYGSLKHNKVLLKALSPINNKETIQSPLLLIHGKNDTQVPLDQTLDMYKALKKLNKKVEKIIYTDEGHIIYKKKNRLNLYKKIITFIEN
ncbi:MAG: alpha/beta hydrolase family protein [Patescibacteria group bacterium]